MTTGIGYYVHHHGMGHLSRALAIAEHMPGRLTLLGTGLRDRCGDVPHLDLPDDRLPEGEIPARDWPKALHYAPLGHDGIRRRAAALTAWIASRRPGLLVVDVSAEIAMLARLASTPVLYVRLAGRREDDAHLDAFRAARALAAPFHPLLDSPGTPEWIRRKTHYFPGLTPPPPNLPPRPDSVAVVLGAGGTAITGAELAAAAAATPGLDWRIIGRMPPTPGPPNLHHLGWIADPAAEIAAAEIIIGGAGDGVVNAVLAASRRFICLPQARPYHEQHEKSRRLAAIGAAITLDAWPDAAAWPGIIAQARNLNPEPLRHLHDPDGPSRAADFITRLATRG